MPEENLPTSAVNSSQTSEEGGSGVGSFLKGRLPLVLAIGGTVVLAGIAVFTAIRLYQLRQQRVAPNAPESQAQAQIPTPTPTPTLTPTPKLSLTPTPTGSFTPTPTLRLTPTASVSATPTSKLTVTPTAATLPDAGVAFPTIIGVGLGLILLIASLLLAL